MQAHETRGPLTGYSVRLVRPDEVDGGTVRAWLALEERAVAANPCLSPLFVLPAIEHLSAGLDATLALVERRDPADLIGLGVFSRVTRSRVLPLQQLLAYRSPHSPVSGVLLDRKHTAPAAEALAGVLCAPGAPWHGVGFTSAAADDAGLEALLESASRLGARWIERERWSRAALRVSEAGEGYLETHLSARRRKSLRQKWRRLEREGEVSWAARVGAEITDGGVDRFLELEDGGWKGVSGSSLLARPQNERFFREMFGGFRREGRAFMAELSVGDRVIASSTNLISAGAGLLWKAGWSPEFARSSPGVLNEIGLTRHLPELLPELSTIDGAAPPGSYLDEIWTGRRWMISGVLATSPLGRRLEGMLAVWRRLRRRQRSAT